MLHVSDLTPAPPAKSSGALTPGLAALLDKTCETFRKDELYKDIAGESRVLRSVSPDQLSLFDYNDAGDAVSWKGEYL